MYFISCEMEAEQICFFHMLPYDIINVILLLVTSTNQMENCLIVWTTCKSWNIWVEKQLFNIFRLEYFKKNPGLCNFSFIHRNGISLFPNLLIIQLNDIIMECWQTGLELFAKPIIPNRLEIF